MEVRYKRDLKSSYLILPVMEEFVKSYQMQMITKNRIEGLLPCQPKTEEGENVCYYEISSKQSLQHIFARSEMGYEELKALLTGIYILLQKLDKYLLYSTCLMLDPEYIYMDIECCQVCLIYLPGYQGDSFLGIRHLSEYILSRVNHTDESAVKIAYYFYQCAKEENFSFRDLVEYMEKQHEEIPGKEESGIYLASECEWNNSYELSRQIEIEDVRDQKCESEQAEMPNIEVNMDIKILQNRILFVGLVGTIIMIAVCSYLFLNFHLQIQEKAIGAALIAVFYVALIMAYIHYGKRYENTKKLAQPEEKAVHEYLYADALEDAQEYGNTVFFGAEAVAKQNFLEGEYKGSKLHYEIEKEQMIIGKMKGKVHIELPDVSVSRIHAGIYQKGDKVLLQDLNSTNGTYKNGVILQPEETVELKPLDEVRFGKICLTYH